MTTAVEPLRDPPGLWWASRNPPADPKTSYVGRTVLVTGANVGIGFECAAKYVALGAASVILGVRTLSKGEDAKKTIIERLGCRPEIIRVMHLDMSVFASVCAFVDELDKEYATLDIAVLNAGVATPSYCKSPEGWEMTLQVDLLSTAYLAILLLPKLQATAEESSETPHLVIVGSGSHSSVRLEKLPEHATEPETRLLEEINQESYYGLTSQYPVAKLLLMYVVQGLAENVEKLPNGDPKVIVNVTCPGFCGSAIGREFPWYITVPAHMAAAVLARTTEEGSRSLVSASSLGKNSHGMFWTHDRIAKQGDLVTSDKGQKLQRKAWAEILDILKRQSPQVGGIVHP